MNGPDDGMWFRPKRYGYGSGLPITWQGWAVLAGYIATLVPIHLLSRLPGRGSRIAALILFVIATLVFLIVVSRKTRRGLKWRWGRRD